MICNKAADIIDCILLADCDIPRISRDLLGKSIQYSIDEMASQTISFQRTATMMQALKFALFSLLLVSSGAQEYDYEQGEYGQDYAQDNLYHDYAMKQQEKDGVTG